MLIAGSNFLLFCLRSMRISRFQSLSTLAWTLKLFASVSSFDLSPMYVSVAPFLLICNDIQFRGSDRGHSLKFRNHRKLLQLRGERSLWSPGSANYLFSVLLNYKSHPLRNIKLFFSQLNKVKTPRCSILASVRFKASHNAATHRYTSSSSINPRP